MTTVLRNRAQAQEARVAVELTAQQVAALYNLLRAEEDYGDGLPGTLEDLRRALKEKAGVLGLVFREGYAYLG
uniref:Uncharacterized protein n=1 Tax=Thermus caliditerrae TaxID=1330700 RepID=A0A7C5VFH7_9DEIN